MEEKNINMRTKWVKRAKQLMKMKRIMNFLVYTYISKKFGQSQLNVAPSHDGETVTFRNSVLTAQTGILPFCSILFIDSKTVFVLKKIII